MKNAIGLFVGVAIVSMLGCRQTNSTPASTRSASTAIGAKPVLYGHSIGETIQEFVAKSRPATQQALKECREHLNVDSCMNVPDLSKTSHSQLVQISCSDTDKAPGICTDFGGIAYFHKGVLVVLETKTPGREQEWDNHLKELKSQYGSPVFCDKVMNVIPRCVWHKDNVILLSRQEHDSNLTSNPGGSLSTDMITVEVAKDQLDHNALIKLDLTD